MVNFPNIETNTLPSEYYNIMLDTLSDLIWLKDANGTYLYCNKEFESFFGAAKKDIIGKTDFDFVSYELATFFRKHDKNAMNAGKATINEEWVNYASNGKKCYLKTTKTPMHNSKGELIGVLGIGHDITNRKDSEDELNKLTEKLSALASTDHLTSLANRRVFDEHLTTQWKYCKKKISSIALIILDIDYFKNYNDFYGHAAGDECLRKIGKLLSSERFARRSKDIAARYGGEEFAIILSDTNKKSTLSIAERIRQEIESLHIPHQTTNVENITNKVVTISIGVAIIEPNSETNEKELFSIADQGLYQAKSNGRNQCVLGNRNI